jgi:hypothetical protein
MTPYAIAPDVSAETPDASAPGPGLRQERATGLGPKREQGRHQNVKTSWWAQLGSNQSLGLASGKASVPRNLHLEDLKGQRLSRRARRDESPDGDASAVNLRS